MPLKDVTMICNKKNKLKNSMKFVFVFIFVMLSGGAQMTFGDNSRLAVLNLGDTQLVEINLLRLI